jgi:hypothetical protein
MFSLSAESGFAKCIPANEYVPFVGQASKPNRDGSLALGMYSRISPDGRFVMRSFSGDNLSAVTLMEITKQADGTKGAMAYQTDFNNEAFPVQGTWRFLVDLDGSHYRVGDLVRNQKNAKRQFKGGISGFYTAAAEMTGATDQKIVIRSLSWPNSSTPGGSDIRGVGQLKNELVTVRKNADGSYDKADSDGPFSMCNNLRATDGWSFSLPMISTDGTEFSALPQNPKDGKVTIRTYRFGANNKDCEPAENLNVPASKAIFGFPQTGKKAPLVFLSSSVIGNAPVYGIHLYDRDLKRTFFLGDRTKWLSPDSFPGMTKDGRVIYGAKWKDCTTCPEKIGYVITDLYQSDDVKKFRQSFPDQAKDFKQCVTEEEVAKVEADQALMYGLTQNK